IKRIERVGLSLLTAGAIQCKQCLFYKDGKCEEAEQTCTLKEDESCMIQTIFFPFSTGNLIHNLETGCAINCKNSEKSSATQLTVTYCCKHRNFCNDPFLPLSVF
uniref:UPAR/Ly6 domain-containing protein n=1 Tax=Monodelphis domestica TaxID=13616 RepID=A0A5F8H003_MONDO